MLDAVVLTDGTLAPQDMNLQTVDRLSAGGPWGNVFAEPLFAGEFQLVSQRVVGQDHLKLVLGLHGQLIDGIAFRQPPLESVHGSSESSLQTCLERLRRTADGCSSWWSTSRRCLRLHAAQR